MKQNIFRKVSRFVPVLVATVALTGCDAHIDVPDTAVRPGHVLCEDGTALSYTEYQQSGKKAVAVVFDTRQHEDAEGNGYAVYRKYPLIPTLWMIFEDSTFAFRSGDKHRSRRIYGK